MLTPANAPRAVRGGSNAGESKSRAQAIAIYAGARGPKRDAVVLNAAAGLLACGRAADLAAGVAEAGAALDAGAAEATLNHLIIRSRELAGLET